MQQQVQESVVNCLVAFTRGLCESGRVRDGDAAPALPDPPCGLKFLHDGAYCRALAPHPVCPELVREGDHLLINPMARAQDQATPAHDLIGKDFWEAFPQALGSEPCEVFQRAMQERQPARVEMVSPVLHQWVDVSIYPIRDDGLSVYFRDISERKRVEEVEQWLAAIIEPSNDAIISKNLESIVTSWNKGAELLFGYRAEEMIGAPITVLFTEGRQDEEERILERIRRGERVEHFESIRQHKDGSLVEVSLTIPRVKDSRGRIIGASKIARDITKHKQAERPATPVGA